MGLTMTLYESQNGLRQHQQLFTSHETKYLALVKSFSFKRNEITTTQTVKTTKERVNFSVQLFPKRVSLDFIYFLFILNRWGR